MDRKIQIADFFFNPLKFGEEDFQKKVLTDGEYLHQLRLKLKGMRVLCDLLEFGFPSRFRPKSLFECYRDFYRKSGRLRDINVQIDLFNEICKRNRIPSLEFHDFLSGKKKLAKKEFKAYLKEPYTDLPENIRVDLRVKKLQELREKLMAGRIKKILRKREDIFVIENLHWLRRQLKQIVYLNKMKLFDKPVLKKELIERFHQLEVRLGNWHDITVLREYILEYRASGEHLQDEQWLSLITETVKLEEVKVLKSVEEIELE